MEILAQVIRRTFLFEFSKIEFVRFVYDCIIDENNDNIIPF